MKAVFIVFNQAVTVEVQEILDELNLKGFTQWDNVKGRGTENGEPHMGTHTWPALNNALMSVIPEDQVTKLLDRLKALNAEGEEQGLRAFVWNIETQI